MNKKIMVFGSIMVALFLLIIIVAIIIGKKEANKRLEETKVTVNQNGEEVLKVTVDKNVATELLDVTEGEGNYKVFRYNITNKTNAPIKYEMKTDVFVDYMLYKKNEKGEFEMTYHYSVDGGTARGLMHLQIPIGETVERNYRMNNIEEGEYKIEFWLNVDPTKKVNLETRQFVIK